MRIRWIWIAVLGLAVAQNGRGQQLPAVIGWKDGGHYIEQVREGKRNVLYAVEVETGRRTPYTPAGKRVATVAVADGEVVYTAPDSSRKTLTRTLAEERNPTLSPDGKWVAFTRDNDLYAVEVASGREVRFTTDGSDVIRNGYASWVYYEEILGRAGNYRSFWWSPDSRYLAFFRYDDSRVPLYPLYQVRGQHGELELNRYPRAGDPNPEVSIGIVHVGTAASVGSVGSVREGQTIWADFNPKSDQYFGTPFWRPDGKGLLIQWMPREQDNLKLYDIDPATGAKREIYNEVQPTWVDWIEALHWVDDGFMMVRDFDGWQQIYLHRSDGSLKQKLTSGRNWDTRIVRIDEKNRKVYFCSKGEIATRNDLYCVGLDGKGQRRLTFGEYNHKDLLLSPDNRYFLTRYDNSSTPTRVGLVEVKTGKVKVLGALKGPASDSAQSVNKEMLWLKTKEGYDLPAIVYWPRGMERGKRYPLVIQVYGGPGHSSVSDYWSSGKSGRDSSYITLVPDHRGSGHCGKAGMSEMHRQLGRCEMEDYIAWVKLLRTFPQVDSTRVMISGGSYGGYVTALALTFGAGYFQYGYAKYGVMDWRLYDSHYTERYMDSPADNPEGYRAASVFTYLDRYQSQGPAMLRIVHGMMDDNVHMQNSLQLVDRLQQLNKTFELMLFPGERHGWRKKMKFTLSDSDNFKNRYLKPTLK